MKGDSEREMANDGITMISRVLAIFLLMIAPGLLGAYLDKRLSTSWLTATGVCVGMAFGMVGLILVLTIYDQKTKERNKGQPPPKYRKIDDWEKDDSEKGKDSDGE